MVKGYVMRYAKGIKGACMISGDHCLNGFGLTGAASKVFALMQGAGANVMRKSKAMIDGIRDGFGAGFLFWHRLGQPVRGSAPSKRGATVADAWKATGRNLHWALRAEARANEGARATSTKRPAVTAAE